MLRIPAALERRLSRLFPKIRDREKFVAELIEQALEEQDPQSEDGGDVRVGGTLHLFSDGGSRGNPGQAAIAYILEDPVQGEVLKEYKERIGVETNNVAEYLALLQGLKAARQFHPNRLICHLDSELVVKQLSGEYRVKMESLQTYVDEIKAVCDDLPDVVFVHIPREDNYRADALVNQALDEMPAPVSLPPRMPPPPQPSLFTQRNVERPGDAYREGVQRKPMM